MLLNNLSLFTACFDITPQTSIYIHLYNSLLRIIHKQRYVLLHNIPFHAGRAITYFLRIICSHSVVSLQVYYWVLTDCIMLMVNLNLFFFIPDTLSFDYIDYKKEENNFVVSSNSLVTKWNICETGREIMHNYTST